MSKPINRPLNIPGKRLRLTKRMIETAMENTKSNMAAAKWLNVSYNTYKKYATYFGYQFHPFVQALFQFCQSEHFVLVAFGMCTVLGTSPCDP